MQHTPVRPVYLLAVATLLAVVSATAFAFANTRLDDCAKTDGQQDALESIRLLQRDPGLRVPASDKQHLWPENARGETYGTATETALGYHEPDLICVEATNGRTGYAYSEQLAGPEFRSPAEALKWQAEQSGKRVAIPVFEADGSTQVGVFVATDGQQDSE